MVGVAESARGACTRLITVVVLLVAPTALCQDGFRIIVHPDNPVPTLTGEQISRFFLKQVTTWGDGTPVEPVELTGDETVAEAFSLQIHGRSQSAVRSFWQQRIFTGRAIPPRRFDNQAELIGYVRGHPGAIGFVSPDGSIDGVREVPITIAPRLISRVEPEYTEVARDARVEGVVILVALIDVRGRVKSVRVVSPLSHGLTEQAKRAVRKWRFHPAMRAGVPVEAEIQLTVSFRL